MMRVSRRLRPAILRSGLALAAFGLMGGVAMAAPAQVVTDLNVRAGQGTGYGVIDTMPAGSVVDVRGCGDGWCYVSEYGGYASARYLDIGAARYWAPPVAVVPAPVYRGPVYRGPVYGAAPSIERRVIRRGIRALNRSIRQERRETRREIRQERRENRRDRQEARQERRDRQRM